jgi:glutamine amidotransferase
VGAFSACRAALAACDGVSEAIEIAARSRGAPFLGICVGMQLLATRGLEFGETRGLGWIEGDVKRIEPAGAHFKVPHMGWNSLDGALAPALFAGLPGAPHMYFTHSFAIFPTHAGDIAATADHGGRFAAAVLKDNVAGVQFHPEKSQGAGARLLANILEWRP